MLAKVLREALEERNMSSRKAASEIGVAHTTVIRIMEGQSPSHTTLKKIGEWLGTPEQAFALLDRDGASGIAAKLMIFLTKNPALGDKFENMIDGYEQGEVSDADMDDILGYIAYRLSL